MSGFVVSAEYVGLSDLVDLDRRLAILGGASDLTVKAAFAAGATVRDVLWFAARAGRKDICVKFAVWAAERVAGDDATGASRACLDAIPAYTAAVDALAAAIAEAQGPSVDVAPEDDPVAIAQKALAEAERVLVDARQAAADAECFAPAFAASAVLHPTGGHFAADAGLTAAHGRQEEVDAQVAFLNELSKK